jgi:hypothetical protein
VGIDGDGRKVRRYRDLAQMLAEALLIDGEIVGKRQQDGRNDAVRQIVGVSGHFDLPCAVARTPDDLYHAAPACGMTSR